MPAASSTHWFLTVNTPTDINLSDEEVHEKILDFVQPCTKWIVAKEIGDIGGKVHFHAAFILTKARRSDKLSLSLHRAFKMKRADHPKMIKLTYTRGGGRSIDEKLLEHAVVYCTKDGDWRCHGWDREAIAKYVEKSENLQRIEQARAYITAKSWWDRFTLKVEEIAGAQLSLRKSETIVREACRILIMEEGYMPPGSNKPHIACAIALARGDTRYTSEMLDKVVNLARV